MSTPLDPRLSQFATQEEADSYDRWLRSKIEASRNDPRPSIPHEEVMAHAKATIDRIAERKRQERKGGQ